MFKRKREEIKMTSLLTQLDFFNALKDRHRLWANDVDNPQIAQLHLEIIDLIVKIKDTYNRLIDLYQQHNNE